MLSSTTLARRVSAAALLLTLAHGASAATDPRCATPVPTGTAWKAPLQPPAVTGGTIPVYWHVISGNNGAGLLTPAEIQHQMDVLNAGFAGTGWSFNLIDVDWTQNDTWFRMLPGSRAERDAKALLRKGGAGTLNIYSANPGGGVTMGWSSYPWNYAGNPALDGVVLDVNTILVGEGGGPLQYNGDTGTHEVGHWMGLLHTFQGGCSTTNDLVNDTPAERNASLACLPNRDTCAGTLFPGSDPVNNFMDYTDDVCMNHFTYGQGTRMDQVFSTYRLVD